MPPSDTSAKPKALRRGRAAAIAAEAAGAEAEPVPALELVR